MIQYYTYRNLFFLCFLLESLIGFAQCNFVTDYSSVVPWQITGSSLNISGGKLHFNQTPGAPNSEFVSQQIVCPLNEDNWSAQFSFQLDTANVMGHALLQLGNQNANPAAVWGIGVHAFSNTGVPPQFILVAQDNNGLYTSFGTGEILIEQDSLYHILLERLSVGTAKLSVFKDSLLQIPVAGSPLYLSFPANGFSDLQYVLHGNNNALAGIGFIDGSIDYLRIQDGCNAEISGPDTVCAGMNFTYELNTASTYQWNTGENTQQINKIFTSNQLLIGTVSDSNACSASDTLQIVVKNGPTASFTKSGTSSSSIPFTVNFTNNSSNANKWYWDFGDASSSVDKNPSHDYTSFGDFNVKLIATDTISGCVDTAYAQVKVVAITADFTSGATVGCGPTLIQFESLSTGSITNWFWVFGNGSISTDEKPVAIYPNPGNYTVSLTVTDGFNSDTKTISAYIKIGTGSSAPIVQFLADTTSSCVENLLVNFQDQSTNAHAWFWDFGDGDTSHQQNPSHLYDSIGDFTVKLEVTNSIGCVADTSYSNYIKIDPASAAYTASPSNACGPFSTTFQDLSYAPDSIVSWIWDFGDGDTSHQQNPTHLYANTGVYISELTIEDKNGCTNTYSDTIRSGSIKPSADFTATPTRVCIGEAVQFTDQSIDANQWFWDFGDGSGYITQQNPQFSFSDTGDYTITLIACNDGCCDTISKTQDIEVIEPIAAFSMDAANGCSVPHNVQFSDRSYSPSNWFWDFGDGQSSTLQNPSHTYQEIGIYKVLLRVQDLGTGCTDTISSLVNIDTAKTNFAAFPLSGCTPLLSQFADNSRNPVSWEWDFGDGTGSLVKNPKHTYIDSGSYDITLITEVQNGCRDTLVKKNLIKAVEPDVQISASVQRGCLPLLVKFKDLTPGSSIRHWNFGNGDTSNVLEPQITYTQAGLYSVSLRVENADACSNTKVFNQYIEVLDLPSLQSSEDTALCIGNAVQIFASGAQNYTWNNGLVGDSIQLTINSDSLLILNATDSNLCATSDTVRISALALPIADAGVNDSVCLGETASLNATGGIQYLWSNGASTAHLTETVASTSLFHVEVSDTNGCSATDSAYIVIRPQPIVEAGDNDTICLGNIGELNASGTGTLIWSNSNTGTKLIDSPSVNTQYIITLTDAFGCQATDSASIILDYFTNAGIVKGDTICAGDTALLKAYGGLSYQWSTGENTAQIYVSPLANSIYYLTISNSRACERVDSVEIKVNPLPNVDAGADLELCFGDTVNLFASGAQTYIWNNGVNQASNQIIALQDSLFIVEGTDGNACSAFDSLRISVNPLPIANASTTDSICVGEFALLLASGGDFYEWSTGETKDSIFVSPLVTSTYYLSVRDSFSCANVDSVEVFVYPSPLADAGMDTQICAGDTAVLSATGGIRYLWSTGDTSASIQVAPLSDSAYWVQVFNAQSCSDFDTVFIKVNPVANLAISDASFCLGGSTVLNANIGAGATYLWSTGSSTDTIVVHSGGTYTVVAENSFGCKSFDTVEVQVDTALTVNLLSDSLCEGMPFVLDAGNAGAQYLWSTGDTSQTLSISQSGVYSVSVNDAFGCFGSDSSEVFFYSRPTAFAGTNDTICLGDSSLLIASGGLSYVWDNAVFKDTNIVNPNADATYSVVVSDVNNCKDTAYVSVKVNPLPNVNAGADLKLCFGDTANLFASGAQTYLWNNGVNQASNQIIALQDSLFIVEGTDGNACSAVDSLRISVNPLPIANASTTDSICVGEFALLLASGGDFYEWSTGETKDSIFVSPLVTSTYYLSVRDSFSCESVDSVEVIVNPSPVAAAGMDIEICAGDTAVLSATGGISYLWSTGDTSANIQVAPLSDSAYWVQVFNAETCSDFDTVFVKVNPLPQLILSPDTSVCENSVVELNASGADTYQWNTGANSSSILIQVDRDSLLIVTGTNSSTCASTDSIRIERLSLPSINVSNDTSVCIGSALDLSVRGALTYTWSNAETDSNISIIATQNAIYGLTASDANNCKTSAQVAVAIYNLPIFSLQDQTFCTGGGTSLSGPNGNYTYLWSTGDTTRSIFVNLSATYALSVSDSNHCFYSDSAIVKDSSVLALNIPDQFICEGEIAVLDASYPGAKHLWSRGDTTQTISVDTAGIYTVFVQDSFACEGRDTVEVKVYSNPNISIGADTALCEASPLILSYSNIGTSIWNASDTSASFAFIAEKDSNIYLQYIDTNACIGYDTLNLKVFPSPKLGLFAPDSACSNSEIELTATASGDLSWFNGDTTLSTRVVLQSSSYFTALVSDSNSCSVRDSIFVKALALPMVNAGPDTFICYGDTIQLVGNSSLATHNFWSTGDSTSAIQIVPSNSGNQIFFAIDSNTCLASDTLFLEVAKLPLIKFNKLKPKYCIGDTIQVLDIEPLGGVLSGTGISGFTFDPNAVPLDSVLRIEYTITDTLGCTNTKVKNTIVHPVPAPELTMIDTGFCPDLNPISLNGAPFGGRFLGPGVSNDIFIPFYAGAGRHLIRYQFSDSNQCVAADSQYITVYPLPMPTIDTLPNEICVDAAALQLKLEPAGGTLSGKGLQGDTLFVPSLAGVGGPYALVYTVLDSNACSNFTYHEISVKALPGINFPSLQAKYCFGTDTINLSASPRGGYFSGIGVDSINSQLVFDSSFSQSTIVYHYLDSQSLCANTRSKSIELLPELAVNFSNASDSICANTDYVFLEASPIGGVFSGQLVSNGIFRTRDLSSDTSYQVYYSFTDGNNCTTSDTATYFIRALPKLEILNTDTLLCAGEIEILVNPEGGYFSGAGQYDGVLYPEVFSPGIYTVKYSYQDENACLNEVHQNFEFAYCTSIEETGFLKQVQLLPNPFTDKLLLSFNAEMETRVNISMRDISGKQVWAADRQVLNARNTFELNIGSQLAEGMYFITISNADKAMTFKVIKSQN